MCVAQLEDRWSLIAVTSEQTHHSSNPRATKTLCDFVLADMDFSLSLLALIVAVAAWAARSTLTYLTRRELIRRQGCQPIAKFPSKEPFSRDFDRIFKKSLQDGTYNATAMEQYTKCGSNTYQVHSVNEHVIHTMEPINHVTVATKTDDWKKDARRGALAFFGRNIMDQNDTAWKKTRDLVVPLFNRAELRELEFFGKFVDRFIENIPRDGSTVDLQLPIRKLFLDSCTDFIFGESIDSLQDTSGETERFIEILNKATKGAGARIRPTGYMLMWNNLFGDWDKEWLADCKVVNDYVDGCIARYRSRSKDLSTDRKRYVLIDGMSEKIQDPVDLRFQLLGIFSIARETVAMAFSNVMFVLARNPHVWSELRKEALALDQDVSFEQLNKLSSFRNTVMEGIRLHSPVPRVRRVSARDTVLPVGGGPDGSAPAFVPKGTTIWSDRYPKTRDPTTWGDDVDDFRPSRFEGRKVGWEFQPFSGGPRVCPASQQVIMQCMYLLFRLVREFETIENRDPCLEFVEGILMCLQSRNGCQVALRPA